MDFLIYISPFLFGVILTIWLIKKTYPNTEDEAPFYFFLMMLSISIWFIFYIIELLAYEPNIIFIAHRLKFIGIMTMPVFWFCFSLVYTKKLETIKRKWLFLLLLVPLFNLVLLYSTHIHGLFYSDAIIQPIGPLNSLMEEVEIGFFLHTAYSYTLILIGIILILLKAFRRKNIYLKQSIMLIIGVLLPLFGNLIFISELSPLPENYDITPVIFSISGLAIWYAFSKLKLLDIFPIAREVVFENISDAIIVIDNEDRLVDYNQNAETFLRRKTKSNLTSNLEGKGLNKINEECGKLVKKLKDKNKIRDTVKIECGENEKWYDINTSIITSKRDKKIGKVLILRDITARKKAENRAEFLHSLLRHDLGNKLQITMGFLELLKDADLSEEYREYISDSLTSIDEGIELIENVRTLNNLESGETEIKDVNLKKTIDESLDRHKDLVKKLDFEIENNITEEVEVKGGLLLKEMFSNLIENSLTHSNGSKVLLSMKKEEKIVKTIMEDDGDGIPDEKKKKITKKGFKGEESSGSGLGMHLVNEIIETYDGKLKVSDSKLGGARFEIILNRSD